MKAITLRNLPPELADRIEAEAERSKASLNATVIKLLEQALGTGRFPGAKKRDLSDLGGSWTDEEADAFDRRVAQLNDTIDLDLWQTSKDS